MNVERYEDRNKKGSITVFLSLVFVIIFSLIMTSLEAAKSAAVRSFADMLLICAAESEAAEFYRPLFDEYHLFGIDTGFGSAVGDITGVALQIVGKLPPNIWNIENESCTLSDYEMIMDGSGEIFTDQAVKYEMLNKTGEILSELAEKIGLISRQGKTAKVLQKRLEAEEKIAKIDKLTIELMKYIDGVSCNLEGDGKAKYSVESGFVKRFLNVQASMASAQINNSEVFGALAGKYTNPCSQLEELYGLILKYAATLKTEEGSREELRALNNLKTIKETELSGSRSALTALNAVIEAKIVALELEYKEKIKKEKSEDEIRKLETELNSKKESIREEYRTEISECESAITRFELEILEYASKIGEEELKLSKYIEQSESAYKETADKAAGIYSLFAETAGYVQEALLCVIRIRTAQAEAEPKVDEYGQLLADSKEDMSPDIAWEYEQQYGVMEEYISRTSAENAFDYETAENTLRMDKSLLEHCGYESILSIERMNSQTAFSLAQSISELKEKTGNFSYEGFVFDYSGFSSKGDDDGSEGISREVIAGFGNSFLNLLLKEPDKLSQTVISTVLLPSRSEPDQAEPAQNPDNTGISSINGDFNGAGAMAGSIGESGIDEISGLSDAIKENEDPTLTDESGTSSVSVRTADNTDVELSGMLKTMAMIMYLGDSFGCYTDQSLTEDTVMKYEQEYIVCGKSADNDNLTLMLLQILLLRLTTCGIYVFSNTEMNKQAEAVATAAVGFTGMPFLIAMAKYLILFIWAFEEASVETAALALGKRISLTADGTGFAITMPDLVRFSPQTVQNKAGSYPERNPGISYKEYLYIFMLTKGRKRVAYRAMDLIQENLRYEYNEDFLMINCMTGFSAEAVFIVKPQFIRFGGYKTSSGYILKY